MAQLTENDLCLLNEAGGENLKGGTEWLMLRRNGHVLLCVPEDSRYEKGLLLYQPQSKPARLIMAGLKMSGFIGKKFYPFHRQNWGAGGFIKWLEAESGEVVLGALLGNATQRERRVVTLTEGEGQKRVWKAGFSKEAKEVICLEHEKLCSLPVGLSGVPQASEIVEKAEWIAFSIPYIAGESVSVEDLREIADLLQSWLSEEKRPALEFPSLSELSDFFDNAQLETLKRMNLSTALRHGDFAPWNVLRETGGQLKVIDWEMAEPKNGVPGWDLAHLLLQEALLVKKLDHVTALDWVLAQLASPEVTRYLKISGWGEEKELLLLTYTQFCDHQSSFDFEGIRNTLGKSQTSN